MGVVYERVLRQRHRGNMVRMWCQADSLADLSDDRVAERQRADFEGVLADLAPGTSAGETAGALARLPFCSAVEVSRPDGDGVLVYPEWP